MNKELGLTAEMFGFGAGVFFFGYFIFEVPSDRDDAGPLCLLRHSW
jgi:hypothetical protein